MIYAMTAHAHKHKNNIKYSFSQINVKTIQKYFTNALY